MRTECCAFEQAQVSRGWRRSRDSGHVPRIGTHAADEIIVGSETRATGSHGSRAARRTASMEARDVLWPFVTNISTQGTMRSPSSACAHSVRPGPRHRARRRIPTWDRRKEAPARNPRPTVVLRDGQPFLGLSSPGADARDQQALQALHHITVFNMRPQHAFEAPRFNTLPPGALA